MIGSFVVGCQQMFYVFPRTVSKTYCRGRPKVNVGCVFVPSGGLFPCSLGVSRPFLCVVLVVPSGFVCFWGGVLCKARGLGEQYARQL